MSSSSSGPVQTPPFLTKLYQLVSDQSTSALVSWTDASGLSFTVHKPNEFGRDVLPKYFKHNNFSSFVRQLNQYGFHKQNPDHWMFGHNNFRRDNPELLRNITRRRPKPQGATSTIINTGNALSHKAVVELGNYGIEGEVKALKRDKDLLIKELVVTRQAEEKLKNKCDNLESRMESLEKTSMRMQTFIMHYFSQVLQPYSQAMESRKRKRIASGSGEDMIDVINDISSAPHNSTAQPIAHPPPPAPSMDTLRAMMQQMQMNIAMQPSQSSLPPTPTVQPSALSPIPEPPTNSAITFAPATVLELPIEDIPSTSPPSAPNGPQANGTRKNISPKTSARPPHGATSFETNLNGSALCAKENGFHDNNLRDDVFVLLDNMPSTPESSFTMDAIESALKETHSQSNGTHLDTPDYDGKHYAAEDEIESERCEAGEKAIEEFLDLDTEDTPLPPPLTHLPDGTDVQALAMRIEGMVDSENMD